MFFVLLSSVLFFTLCVKKSYSSANIILNGTVTKPFLFFHIPKTGGSTMKGFLFNHLYEKLKSEVLVPNYGLIPGAIHEKEVTTIPYLRNLTSCSTAILSHFTPRLVGSIMFKIELGLFGLTKCRRGWWDHKNIKDYMNITNLPNNMRNMKTVSQVEEAIRKGKKKLKEILLSNVDTIDQTKLAIEIVEMSNCMVIFREPISRLWSWYHFFKYPRFSNITLYDFIEKNGVQQLYSLTGGSIQNQVVGEENSLLRESIFKHCYIGVQEHYHLIRSDLHSLHPLLQDEKKFPKHPFSASIKVEAEKLDDFPVKSREQLKLLLSDDAKLWKRAYYQVMGNHNYTVKYCEWCANIWKD